MTSEESLRKWLIQLSTMVGGTLEDSSSLDDGLLWFTELPESDLAEINSLGKDNPAIQDFLDLGQELMNKAMGV